jgi:hypothetical protein
MTGTDATELEHLPGWESLVAAGAVEPPRPAVMDAAVAAVRRVAQNDPGPRTEPPRLRPRVER